MEPWNPCNTDYQHWLGLCLLHGVRQLNLFNWIQRKCHDKAEPLMAWRSRNQEALRNVICREMGTNKAGAQRGERVGIIQPRGLADLLPCQWLPGGLSWQLTAYHRTWLKWVSVFRSQADLRKRPQFLCGRSLTCDENYYDSQSASQPGFVYSPGKTQHIFRGGRSLCSHGFSSHTHKGWNVASQRLVSSSDLQTLPSFFASLKYNSSSGFFILWSLSHRESQFYKITGSGWSLRTILSKMTHSPGSRLSFFTADVDKQTIYPCHGQGRNCFSLTSWYRILILTKSFSKYFEHT